MENLTLVIPAKREAESLPVFLKELSEYNYKKIIVMDKDDESTINSIKDFKDVEILFQKERGYGSALIEGINATKTKYFCIINADGSMNPSYLKPMLELVSKYDLVFTTRYEKGGGSDDDDIITLVGNKIFSLIGRVFFNLKISDILFTYIIGSVDKFKSLNIKFLDFRICVEIPIKAKRNNLQYTSISSYERSRIGGKKKVNPIKDGFLILTAMIKLFFLKNN